MAVPEQTPYKEYTANGITKIFPLEFDVLEQDHLIVLVNDLEPSVGSWLLDALNDTVVFALPPANGANIKIRRDTPMSRSTDYQTYNNSFRPEPVNEDLDNIWRKLQEMGVLNWMVDNNIKDLGDYVDGLNDETKAQFLAEIQKQGISLNQLENFTNQIYQNLANVAVSKGWFAEFVADGDENQKQINDKTVQYASTLEDILNINVRKNGMQTQTSGLQGGLFTFDASKAHINDGGVIVDGWVRNFAGPIYVEWFGATEGGDNTSAFQKAFNYIRTVKGGEITSNLKTHIVSNSCTYHDYTTIDLKGGQVKFTGTGMFASALYNKDRTEFLPYLHEDIYYKNQTSISVDNPVSKIAVDALKKSSSIVVENANKFSVGDYVFLTNGYCDMWRVMEQYNVVNPNKPFQDWVRPDVDLWRCEIAQIKGIVGNTIYFHDQISNDYLVNVKKYGFFIDENDRADHQGWNFARIERLGGASNCNFKNINILNDGNAFSIVSYCSVNNNALDCTVNGTGQGIEFMTCYNSHVLRCYSNTSKFGQSIRRGSSKCILGDASANYVSGDCPLIIWEGANLCIANNLSISGTGGNVDHAKIGFYFNTCWDCVGSNFTGKNLDSVVAVLFCRGNVTANNIVGCNVGVLINSYCSFDVKADTGFKNGQYKDSISDYDLSVFSVSISSDIRISNMKDIEKYSSIKSGGRAHIYKSFAVDVQGIDAENVILWNSVDDEKVYDSSKFKMKVSESNFKSGQVIQTLESGNNQTRLSAFKHSKFMQNMSLDCVHNVAFSGVEFLGKDVNKSLILTASHYTRFIDCVFKNLVYGIDFRGYGAVGSENWSSLVYFQNTSIDAPTRFLNYSDPTYIASINNLSPQCKNIQYISVLNEFPKLKTLANPLGNGNVNGWVII